MSNNPEPSADFFRIAVEAAPNAMIMADPNGRITMVNSAAENMFGYTRAELLSSTVETLVPDHVRARHSQYRAEYLRAPAVRAMGAGRELTGRRKDGSQVPIEIGLNPITTPKGVMVLASIVDITERVRAAREREELETRVRHSQKLESLGVLAGGIAHDFNNLLSAILGNAELALLHVSAGSPAAEHLERIFSTTRRAAELSRQMLAYSGRASFEIRHMDVSEAVKGIAELLHVSVSKKAEVRFEFGPDLPQVNADVAQFNQIVMNLITNASEALGDKPGQITVRTGVQDVSAAYLKDCLCDDTVHSGQFVFFEVQDTGSGMDAATKARIFDPFFTTKFTGRGLGLSAVLGIMRGHKGAVNVQSAPGIGTSMRMLFPAIPRVAKRKAAGGEAAAWRGSGKVLVVDDESLLRYVARAQLESMGFEVIEANDGAHALEVFAAHGPELVLAVLDFTMPRLDGDQAASKMRETRPDLPIVLCSGYGALDLSERLRNQPSIVLMSKPYSLSEMRDAVRRALKQ
jgi:PAS domain S-box-containing protein